jgi:phage terminase large subunit GpA-like protein
LFEEHHKPEMLAAGKWVPHHSKAKNKKVKGYHLSSLYSPLGWLSWTAIAQEWIDSMNAMKHGDTSLLRVFINTRLAETFEDQGERADEHTLWKRADDFPLGRVKWHHFVVTMGCDVQRDRVECYVWAWGRGMERQLVARHVCFGDPNIPENEPDSPWTKLTEIRREPIFHASGLVVPVVAVFIDSGGSSTQAVYQYCRQWQHAHVWAIKGQSQAGKPILGRPSTVDINWRGAKVLGGLKLWPLGVDTAKFEIYNSLRLDKVGAGYINLTRELPMEVFEQLTSEKLITSYVNGQPRQKWVLPSGKRNEALDCAVYALAGAHYAGLTRWKEKEWMKAELRVEPSDMIKAGVNPPKRIRAEPKPVEEPREPKPQAKKVTRDW